MSQWGKLDRFALPGTVIANTGSTTVVTTQDQTANIKIGYALVLGNVEYVVANVVNTTTYTLDVAYEGANTQGAVSFAAVQQSPKSLRTYGWGANLLNGANTVNSRNVYGIDKIEADDPTNKNKGISHSGWVHYQTWVNTQGQTRNRAEVLVAMSKNFNYSNVDFNVGLDANEDAVIEDYYLWFSRNPAINGARANITAGRVGASYSVIANTTGTFGNPTINYKWQKSPNNIVWVDVIDAPFAGNVGFSGNTTANLSIANVYADATTQNTFLRVVISTAGTVSTNTSANVQVLVIPQ
jgi:hypothetical protein